MHWLILLSGIVDARMISDFPICISPDLNRLNSQSQTKQSKECTLIWFLIFDKTIEKMGAN